MSPTDLALCLSIGATITSIASAFHAGRMQARARRLCRFAIAERDRYEAAWKKADALYADMRDAWTRQHPERARKELS